MYALNLIHSPEQSFKYMANLVRGNKEKMLTFKKGKAAILRRMIYFLLSFGKMIFKWLVRMLRCFLEKMTNIIVWLSIIAGQGGFLVGYFGRQCEEMFLHRDYSKEIAEIVKNGIVNFDIGARGGTLKVVQKYSRFFKIVMCEPEKEEANRLRNLGHTVIDKAISGKSGEVTFYECRLPAGSSIYKPQGPYLDFYNPDPNYMSLYDVINTSRIECITVSEALSDLNIPELDFLKIDTQGAELDILMSLGNYMPLIIMCEIEWLPLWQDVPNAYEVMQYLYNLGYIPFQFNHQGRNLCPIIGDGFFMPSWVHPAGKELIRLREEKYIALMLMFGQIEILKFVNNKIGLENKEFVESLGKSKLRRSVGGYLRKMGLL